MSTGDIPQCSAAVALAESFVSTVHLDNCASGHLFPWRVAKCIWLGLSRILMPSSEEFGIMNPVCVTPDAVCGLYCKFILFSFA